LANEDLIIYVTQNESRVALRVHLGSHRSRLWTVCRVLGDS